MQLAVPTTVTQSLRPADPGDQLRNYRHVDLVVPDLVSRIDRSLKPGLAGLEVEHSRCDRRNVGGASVPIKVSCDGVALQVCGRNKGAAADLNPVLADDLGAPDPGDHVVGDYCARAGVVDDDAALLIALNDVVIDGGHSRRQIGLAP